MDTFRLFDPWDQGSISAIDCYGSNLYVGTTDGHLYLYTVDAKLSGFSREAKYVPERLVKKTLRPPKKIQQIQVDKHQQKVFTLHGKYF